MLFDVHLHSEGLTNQDLESLSFFGVTGALVPAHAHLAEPTVQGLISQFERLLSVELPRLQGAGIQAYAALGVHPRALPKRGVAEVLSTLPHFVRGGKVAAIGPLGLYEGDASEVETFVDQLALAKQLQLPVVVQAPVRRTEPLTRRTLALLRESGFPAGRVLVEGVSARVLGSILALGYCASLVLHPDGMRVEQAVRTVAQRGPSGLCLSSRAGDGGSDIFSPARAKRLMEKAELSPQVVSRLCQKNARRFFGL